jgi:hypothetical protein
MDPKTLKPDRLERGPAVALRPGRPARLALTVPDTGGWPVTDVGVELSSGRAARGVLHVDRVEKSGSPRLFLRGRDWPADAKRRVPGWIGNEDYFLPVHPGYTRAFPDAMKAVRNEGFGFLVTGNTDWTDYSVGARLAVHVAERAGLIARFQGLERYLALVKTATSLRLVLRYYGERVLDERACVWAEDEAHTLRLGLKGERVVAYCDGKAVLSGREDRLGSGGAGFLFQSGTVYVAAFAVGPRAARI